MTDKEIFEKLIGNLNKYHPSDNFSMVIKAYDIARAAHEGQLRKSGEPYIIHPLEVAVILSECELDRETICAGILHDVIEDTVYSYADVASMFGEDVAHLVDGVTKLERLQYSSKEEKQADNYRKMFLAMSNDIRVILIKLADRLHNLRTLQYMTPNKQKEIAQETLDIYAPLAHRLGISKIRYELEDLSFRYLQPDEFFELSDKIVRKQSEREEYVKNIVDSLKAKIGETQIKAYVEGRPKHFFSIYKKMVSQEKTLDQIYDLFAVRVVAETVRDCYEVLGIVHEMFKPIPGRFKDYIAMPKANMYQSLHNTLIGPEGEPFEVQIRTWEMHKTADYGIAAHWKYKEGSAGKNSSGTDNSEAKLAWLRQILEWQREMSDNREYLDALKFDLNVYKDHVYCFTPRGAVISLVNDATPIDFAYAIHSAVGNKMVGAKVNGRIVPLDFKLSNGDRVEILTSQNSKGPNRDWLKIVRSNQAKTKINQWFKKENKEENIARGKDLLEKGAKKKGVTLSALLTPERISLIANKYSLLDWDAVCAAVGHGGIKEGQIINRLYEDYQHAQGGTESDEELIKKLVSEELAEEVAEARKRRSKPSGIVVKGVGDISVRFSKCCGPMPGDEIVGFVTRGRGVSIHRTDCVNMLNLDDLERHRLMEAEWHLPETSAPTLFRAEISIVCDDRIGMLTEIMRVITDEGVDVKTINARPVKSDSVINMGINVTSREHLEKVRQHLFNLSGVHEIERITT